MDRVIRRAPELLLVGALAASAALVLHLTREFTFLQDTWEFLMNRRGFTAEALFTPHTEHLVVIPVLLEQLLLHLFGMSSARPEYVAMTVALLVTACLLFFYARRRVGPWLALFAAVLLLFLGPAWEAILWPFEITFVGAVLFGVAMLLALDRDDRSGDLLACVFLTLSFGFSSVGIPFAAAAAVDLFQKRRARGLRRAYLLAVPVLLYAAWYAGWGHDAETQVTLGNVLASPRFVFEAAATAVGSVFGLGTSPFGGSVDPVWVRAVLLVAIVALGYRRIRRRSLPAGFWPVAATAAVNWFLTAFNAVPGREATSSRYQYLGAVLVLMLLANLLQDVRIGRRALFACAAVTLAAVASNLVVLRDGKEHFLQQSVLTRADTAAIEIARRTVAPEFSLSPEVAGTTTLVDVQAAKYLQAVREYGSPAYTPAELARASELGRRQADIVLAHALPLSTSTRRENHWRRRASGRCTTLPAGAPEVRVAPGLTRVELAPGPDANLAMRRFAVGEFPLVTEGVPGGSVTLLRVPRDAAVQPWRLQVEASQQARVCR